MPERADAELVRRGLARSRKQASVLIADGRVRIDGTTVAKASFPVPAGGDLSVEPDPDDPGYASRAGGKLAGALEALEGDVAGRELPDRLPGASCLDVGASTGGFTDVLLRRGAAHVTALDVGHDQLVPALRTDPRVTVREGLNVRHLVPDDLGSPPDVVVGDLSFISLRLVVPAVAGVTAPGALVLLLVKPQFEVGRDRLGSGGVVRDPDLHVESVLDVGAAAAAAGLPVRAVVPSALPGPSGNREYFCWMRRGEVATADRAALTAAARTAVAWQPGAGTLPPVVRVPADVPGGDS
ncbi:23S rRNA (cytidine1920-2'-O)/16S rRNA (cytidine1409-2'-O)-methyltransferase [Isoptericola sp. CG 20/1183]|uniref:23S rRNA (Cytidine1920-2'-O)/16S rRNA (Cytidine1409-2'-O)-methyltransferase n=1 Tax=Isoptericola halotolerans TaxID=300560 RepID=A0ABX5EC04_9MICO|nr:MULTISPECIES: TlyA family RNA methyltransferase [Isoptericola]PRZ02581.1 23S rRNA (cytidine1920-2'-O)/16S rRNA (cytidine1409-2'-O)-methyltransferase [Isoptericola sp. CG 20/1183]PRZ02862.1 23S rRNA (cytidine1920-2'-O)/16S rRNA (cytidine1409-2'-O)-methyltransferase [Isoptericola halotolerans]